MQESSGLGKGEWPCPESTASRLRMRIPAWPTVIWPKGPAKVRRLHEESDRCRTARHSHCGPRSREGADREGVGRAEGRAEGPEIRMKPRKGRTGMVELPPAIRAQYRVATAHDVRFLVIWPTEGCADAERIIVAGNEGEPRRSGNFGPLRDFVLRLRKIRGQPLQEHDLRTVPREGGAGTGSGIAGWRGVELSLPIPHPLSDSGEPVKAFPLLPASYFESAQGAGLAERYEVLLVANRTGNVVDVHGIEQIVELLLPVAIQSHAWNLRDADTLTRGLGLIRKGTGAKDDGRCECCGYVIAGLDLGVCPGCGETIRRR